MTPSEQQGSSRGSNRYSRRALLGASGAMLAALSGCLGSPAADTETQTTPATESLTVTSDAFQAGERVPTAYTCDGADRSPPLAMSGVSPETEALAIVVDDPDGPGGTFTHWLLWNLTPESVPVPEGVPKDPVVDSLGGARQGENDFGEIGYRGPCPPSGEVHTYRFTAYALDESLAVESGASADGVAPAIEEHRIGYGQLRATYG